MTDESRVVDDEGPEDRPFEESPFREALIRLAEVVGDIEVPFGETLRRNISEALLDAETSRRP